VNFAYDSNVLKTLFVECLAALPNLHTLEIGTMLTSLNLRYFTATLGENKLPIRTIALPPWAHFILRYCPNVEDLTCSPATPDEVFVDSLVLGGSNHVTKLSVACPAGENDHWLSKDICSSRPYFISR